MTERRWAALRGHFRRGADRPHRLKYVLMAAFLATASVSAADQTAAAASDKSELYTVKDGDKVDERTLMGWKTWRALACERCHGAQQEGLVGPPLVESMKRLTKEEFHTTMINGRPEKGMPPFSTSKMVTDNWEGLYAYLKGRADGQIKPGRLSPLEQ
jgi:mono/diheme cytochrome c family protein